MGTSHPGLYQPRRAADSPLYRIVQDTLETYLAEAAPGTRTLTAEEALRRFLECGVHRFGVMRFLCRGCGIEMVPVAAIVANEELVRLLTHLGIPVEFPKTKLARSPPLPFRGEESQIDPSLDAFDGVDEDWGWHAP